MKMREKKRLYDASRKQLYEASRKHDATMRRLRDLREKIKNLPPSAPLVEASLKTLKEQLARLPSATEEEKVLVEKFKAAIRTIETADAAQLKGLWVNSDVLVPKSAK